MNSSKLVLGGKTLFIVFVFTIILTILIVYISGFGVNRSFSGNFIYSLSIITVFFFAFLCVTLYKGTKLINDYPKFKSYEIGSILDTPEVPNIGIDIGEGLGGIIASIIIWIVIALLLVVLVIVFEAILWISLFILFTAIYWIFIRALRLVYYKGRKTRGKLLTSILSAAAHSMLYTGWIFGIALILHTVT